MVEITVVTVVVLLAACYWYARLFPRSWSRARVAVGLASRRDAVPSQGKACDRCPGCKSGGCH